MITIKTNVDQSSIKFFRGVITNYIDSLEYDVDACTMNEIRSCISEMISNVLAHAYPESDNKPTVITINHLITDEQTKLVITVEDDGIGMSDVKKCMEPLYTTVGDESRCGLGFTILETMSDNLLVTSNPNFGTRVEITKYI